MNGAAPGTSGQLLTLAVDGRRMGVPARTVREVMRMPRLTRVPHAPVAMLGLANVRGVVMPVLSLAALTGGEPGRERRLVVLDAAEPVGLAVDAVAELVDGGDGSVERVDALALVAHSAVDRHRKRATAGTAQDAATQADAVTVPLVCFAIGNQAFALQLHAVEEVLRLPSEIAAVPNAAPMILGSADVRGTLLPLLLLPHLLALPGEALSARTRVLVVRIGEERIGLVVDAMQGIIRVAERAIDPVPAVLTRGDAEARIQAVCRLGGGKLVSILAPEHLLREDITAQLLRNAPANRDGGVLEDGSSSVGSERFLLCSISGATFGLPLAAVEQVLKMPATLTRLPRSPDFVRGVMQLRGEAIAVIDQARRFGAGAGTSVGTGTKQRIVVVQLGRKRAGFLVESASEIRGLPEAALQPAPCIGADATQVFERVAMNDGGAPMLILSPVEMLDHTERDLLDAMTMPNP